MAGRDLCRYGSYIKKEEYTKQAFNPKTQQPVLARRTRAVERAFELPGDLESCDFLLSRFWAPEGEAGGGSES